MSNSTVGTIYQRVMQEVLEGARVDFEESGVDQSALDELRQVWQKKLSSLRVAQFPWDPSPEPNDTPSVVPSNTHVPTPPPASSATLVPSPSNTDHVNRNIGPSIKTEPGLDDATEGLPSITSVPVQPPSDYPSASNSNNPQLAAHRAANFMQEKFGNQANNSIGALHLGLTLPGTQTGQSNAGTGIQPNSQGQTNGPSPGQPPQSSPPQPSPSGAPVAGQTDGGGDAASEWSGVLVRRNPGGENQEIGRVAIDGMIRQYVEERGRQMEGGGLMVPMSQYKPSSSRGVKRAISQAFGESSNQANEASSLRPPQFDGPGEGSFDSDTGANGDEDDPDADAINSDLDDSEDEFDDNPEEDEGMGHIMLCMYDKVQRVKNKWKCVMKDGVLQVGGKEYVFHKATGEYEW